MSREMLFVIFLILLTSICDTISQLFLKSAVNSLEFSVTGIKKVFGFILKVIRIPWVWVGFLFSLLSLCIWLFVLSQADLNFAFSVDSMHYILIAMASRLVLKEKVSFTRWMGIVAIVGGILLVTAG